MAKLDEVFGVSSKPVLSYVQRESVDDQFINAVRGDKQIVVYGSSKQGKTALVQQHLPYENNLVVRLTPKTSIPDVYKSILRQLSVELKEGSSDTRISDTTISGKTGFKAMVPFFGGADLSAEAARKNGAQDNTTFKEVPFNLELAQDVAEVLKTINFVDIVILENFHYLDDEKQKQLAFDLRTFQELGIRFVILGVWREKNRLVQFNGDLVDRIVEIPVEPWKEEDFLQVAQKGQEILNIEISEAMLRGCLDTSFSSIGVFQELLKEVCRAARVEETTAVRTNLDDVAHLREATVKKAADYASRHQRSLEAIAAGYPNSATTKGESMPLFLPYYLVRVILENGYDGLAGGMRRATIQDNIQKGHHRPNDVRASDMSNLLHNLAALQAAKDISPPIIDYDRTLKSLQAVDSTFYFFLKNADLKTIFEEIVNPVDDAEARRGGRTNPVSVDESINDESGFRPV